jgi:phage shock protein A
MSIRFTQRLGRLIRADAHGIIESLEDRALLLKQHLREAELELQRKRARISTLDDEERQLGDDVARLERAAERLDDDTRLALAGNRDDLARFALRRLLPRRRERDSLRERSATIRADRARLVPKLAEQEEAFEDLELRIRNQLAANAQGEPAGGSPLALGTAAEEEVEMELLRRMQPVGAER